MSLLLILDLPEVVDQNSGDSAFQYSCCMLWRGLLHMVQTNAERYNTGEQLIEAKHSGLLE